MAKQLEWPTLVVAIGCYLSWGIGTYVLAPLSLPLAILVVGVAITLHSSLQHEIIHGHPFKSDRVNAALVFPALGLMVPFERFRDTHLEHHRDANLTDPYDDPESYYLDPNIWDTLPKGIQTLLRANNTLLGRITLGPLISQFAFMRSDWQAICARDKAVIRGWLLHIPALVPVLLWLFFISEMPLWAYLLAAYLGNGVLRIRTYLEHRAFDRASGRSAIIEDRGPLAFLFLNNNFHAVHHANPTTAWYDLRALYFNNRDRYRARNHGYVYNSYGAVFRQYFFKVKEPIAHPFYPQKKDHP